MGPNYSIPIFIFRSISNFCTKDNAVNPADFKIFFRHCRFLMANSLLIALMLLGYVTPRVIYALNYGQSIYPDLS